MPSPTPRLERIRLAIDAYQGRLIRFAMRITGDIESARDVVQDTFLRLCDQGSDVDDHLAAWLFRVCRNRALDVRKKESPLVPLDDQVADKAAGSGADPHDTLERSAASRRALEVLASLPVAQREVLRLRFQEELSYKEISAITNHSVSNVGVLIHTGIKRLRERMRSDVPARRAGGHDHA